jgi:hypothetical protein
MRMGHSKRNSNSKKGKNWIFLGTKDDQVLYSYKNILAQNDSHGILGNKGKIEQAHVHVLFTLYSS